MTVTKQQTYATGASSTFVRTDDRIPFAQFIRYVWHDTGCGKFTLDNEFHVEHDCTCGLANLFGGEPCPCRTCTAKRLGT